MFPESNGQSPNLTAFTSKIQVFCRPEWTKEAKMENEFPKQLGLEKQMKKWGHLCGFHVFILIYDP